MRADIFCHFVSFFQTFSIVLDHLILLESVLEDNSKLFATHIIRWRDDVEMVTPRFKRFLRASHL